MKDTDVTSNKFMNKETIWLFLKLYKSKKVQLENAGN